MPTDIRNSGEWKRNRDRAMRRDQFRCQSCRCREGDSSCVELHVHHIRLVSKGGTNEMENIVTLCGSCHHRLHHRHDDDVLSIDLLPSNPGSKLFVENRKPISELKESRKAILRYLEENGPVKRERIVSYLEYSDGLIGKELGDLKWAGFVKRESRGVYDFVTEEEYIQDYV